MRFLLFLYFIGCSVTLQAQDPKRYWVQFTDKNNTPYSLSEPLQFLSQRAMERRTRQQIPLTVSDLPVDPAYVQAVLDKGAQYLTHSKWLNSVTVIVPNESILDSILSLPFLVNHEPVGKQGKESFSVAKWEETSDIKSTQQQTLSENDYGLAFNQIDMLSGVTLHDIGYRGEGMLIAVLDAGFPNVDAFEVFENLREEGRLLGGWDFVGRNDSIFGNNPHGQSVLSTMAGFLPGEYIGTAPKASYMLLRTEDASSEFPVELDYWVAGAEFADSAGADIINSSLGYTTFDQFQYDFSYPDMDGNTTRASIGADIAASKGILVVNSAGNSGNKPWRYIGAPADGDSVLAVGAVTADGFIANFSSEGPSADGDVKPNVCAQGQLAAIVSSSGGVTGGNGTSFAGPILAGMAACLWQAHPDATNMQIFRAIEQSAHKFSNPDGLYGHGIPNFAKAHLMLSGVEPTDIDESELFPVYPNPFTSEVDGTFYSSSEQRIVIRLVNSLGQEMRKFEGRAQGYSGVYFRFSDLESLAEGMYTLQVESDSGKYFKKLVKADD